MLIEIHIIQNHAPSNLNRDDLGAPKTCYFGGVLRSRISSQSLKRSIRMSKEFSELLGGIRTRRLAELITKEFNEENEKTKKRVETILEKCGIKASDSKKKNADSKKNKKGEETVETDNEDSIGKDSKMLVYTSVEAIHEMVSLLKNKKFSDDELVPKFAELIAKKTLIPDMALTGRMLEPDKSAKNIWSNYNKQVEASLQAAHAFSTHETHPEVDYFVTADDIPGEDSGAGYLDEAMFASSCFYKYYSINWEQLLNNLNGDKELAIHTVGAFLRAAAICSPSGKQNSFAAHNLPDGILVELKKSPVSYANAFAEPVSRQKGRSVVEQSIAQLAQYAEDIKIGYGYPDASIWYSPNLHYKINTEATNSDTVSVASLDVLTDSTIRALSEQLNLNITWTDAQTHVVDENNRLSKWLKHE